MKANPVVWFEIYVQNMPRAKKFYEEVFETKLEKIPMPEPEMWMFKSEQGATGAAGSLVYMPGFPAGGNNSLVYFGCEDCAVEEGRAVKAGGKVEKKKFSIGDYGFISLVYDTEGNMIGLHSMK